MNTKLTFFCTHCQHGDFEKIIFETVLPGTPFESMDDVRDWIDEQISTIYNDFELELVFDWVAINFENTNDEVSPVTIKKTVIGRLTFHEKEEEEVVNVIDEVSKNEIDKLTDEASKLEDEISRIEVENKILELRIDISNINSEIERIKSVKAKPEPRKQYPSAWIDPFGKTFKIGFACHEEFASEWLRENDEKAFERSEDERKYSFEILEGKGWIRILGWTDPPTFVLPNTIGPKQRAALKDFCLSADVPYKDFPEILKS